VLQEGLGHEPYALEATADDRLIGVLPLTLVRSRLFGKFLVSLPYLNSCGVQVDSPAVAAALVDQAVGLADKLQVKQLELRQEMELVHPKLSETMRTKVHMRLDLPSSSHKLWDSFKPAVRNQIRKAEKNSLSLQWGKEDQLADFYTVFSRNMRDLGTPVFGHQLFRSILRHFQEGAEICVVSRNGHPLAAALLCHGRGVTEVPSASSLRRFNSTNANMFMYWHLLQRAIARGHQTFDFGRSTIDSNTYRFKKQWGAKPVPAIWQYYVRHGDISAMRPENKRYQLAIRVWRWLPLALANLLGPTVARGIP
jgi:FemAB-related protein (PEP-CTERM system-associated)